MKIKNLIIILLFSISIVACQPKAKQVAIVTQLDSISYVMGASDGARLVTSFEQAKLDSLVDMNTYFEALSTMATKGEPKINPDSNRMMVQNFMRDFQNFQMMEAQDSIGITPKFTPVRSHMDSISYIMGAGDGKGLINQFERYGLDTVINLAVYLDGLKTAGLKKETLIDAEKNMEMVNEFFKKLQDDQMMAKYGDNKRAGEEFITKNRDSANVITTESGLQYIVLKEGKGPKPSLNDKVKVQYTGMLIDGTVFDSSVERGEPAVFGVGQVIPGWTEALQLMPVGSKWKVFIPEDLAYGTKVRPGGQIKPYSALIFEVELLGIEKDKK